MKKNIKSVMMTRRVLAVLSAAFFTMSAVVAYNNYHVKTDPDAVSVRTYAVDMQTYDHTVTVQVGTLTKDSE